MFATGTVVSGVVRGGKDDMWNQAVGACAAGGVVGARFASARVSLSLLSYMSAYRYI